MAKVVVRNEDLADDPVSSELPGTALVDSKPELIGDARKMQPAKAEPAKGKAAAPRPSRADARPARSATPDTLGRDAARAPARRSSIPPAPAEPAVKRASSAPPAPLPSASREREPARGSRPPVPRPGHGHGLESGHTAAVNPRMVGGAEGAQHDEVEAGQDQGAQGAAEATLVGAPVPELAAATDAAEPLEADAAAAAEAPAAERETLLGVLPTAADTPEGAEERETLLGVPVAAADKPVPRRSETPPAIAQRTAYTVSSYADESRALLTSAGYGAREVHSSEWDSPDTLPKPPYGADSAEQGPTPEMRVAHLLRRLRRTIPLYAPLPEKIRKMIDGDHSH